MLKTWGIYISKLLINLALQSVQTGLAQERSMKKGVSQLDICLITRISQILSLTPQPLQFMCSYNSLSWGLRKEKTYGIALRI